MSGPLDVRVCGPLVPFRDGFVEELGRSGYTPLSAANQVRLFAHEPVDGLWWSRC
jgi:hypothetical protein